MIAATRLRSPADMPSIEIFFLFAALVVAIGVAVRLRDIRSGRDTKAEPDEPNLSMRERFADTGFLSAAEWRTRVGRTRGRGTRTARSADDGGNGSAG